MVYRLWDFRHSERERERERESDFLLLRKHLSMKIDYIYITYMQLKITMRVLLVIFRNVYKEPVLEPTQMQVINCTPCNLFSEQAFSER